MTDDQSKSRQQNKQPIGIKTIRVRGLVIRKVLLFFLSNESERTYSIAKVARVLVHDYQAVRSALNGLCSRALLMKAGEQYLMLERRRIVAQRAYDAEGAPIPIDPDDWDKCLKLQGEQRGLLKVALPEATEQEMRVHLKAWRDVLAMDSAWSENTRITKIRLDPFIIKNIRTATGLMPVGNNKAEWLSVHGQQFTMQVSKTRSLQLWVRGAGWKDELKEWLLGVPNLEERHMDQIWTRVWERMKLMTTTRECHVSEPRLQEGNQDLFRPSQVRGTHSRHDSEDKPVSGWRGDTHLRTGRQRRRHLETLRSRVLGKQHVLLPHEGDAGGEQGRHSPADADSHPSDRATLAGSHSTSRGEQKAPGGTDGTTRPTEEEGHEGGTAE